MFHIWSRYWNHWDLYWNKENHLKLIFFKLKKMYIADRYLFKSYPVIPVGIMFLECTESTLGAYVGVLCPQKKYWVYWRNYWLSYSGILNSITLYIYSCWNTYFEDIITILPIFSYLWQWELWLARMNESKDA